ncbi:MAG: 4-(cytidine 5'-diphospho)-2-C-methyl-D-erythritol kinase [Bacillota bacterium]
MKEKAHAKINLYLDILNKRPDQFHNLEMVMAPLKLHDTLYFKAYLKGSVLITSSIPITDNVEDNLVYKIATYMIDTYAIDSGVHIHIDKRIPIAAGLAGGSADAAATLRGMNRLFKLRLSLETLADIGETFGADIPHCIYNKLCIARGKGEQLVFLNIKLKSTIMLIAPNIRVSTKKVFQAVDMELVPKKKINGINNAIYNRDYDLIVKELYNALEPFTFKKFPKVGALKEELESFQVEGVLMSGSGPTLFVLDRNKKKRQAIFEKFQEKHRVILTKIN